MALVLALCAGAAAQAGGWPAVRGIAPGSRVEVRLTPAAKPKTKVSGRLLQASATDIVLMAAHGGPQMLPRREIEKIYLIAKTHKRLGGLIGAGAGFAAGAIVIYKNQDKYSSSYRTGLLVPNPRAKDAVALGALLAIPGAILGVALGFIRGKTLVYERAPAPQAKSRGAS